jgi:hypothetical protein
MQRRYDGLRNDNTYINTRANNIDKHSAIEP